MGILGMKRESAYHWKAMAAETLDGDWKEVAFLLQHVRQRVAADRYPYSVR